MKRQKVAVGGASDDVTAAAAAMQKHDGPLSAGFGLDRAAAMDGADPYEFSDAASCGDVSFRGGGGGGGGANRRASAGGYNQRTGGVTVKEEPGVDSLLPVI